MSVGRSPYAAVRLSAGLVGENAVVDARHHHVVGVHRFHEPSGHVLWRMKVARQIAEAYGATARLAALTVAGSVGAGLADRWSDLELDCYWSQPPTEADRSTPIHRVGGVIEAFWDYDKADQEWSEDYRLGPLAVTVSNFTVETIAELLNEVVENADTDPVKHMRLAAIQRCNSLRGPEFIDGWKVRAGQYPDQLVTAMIEESLTPSVLTGWSAREALVGRGDEIAVHALLSRIEQALVDAVLALNRTYRPHRVLKWQRTLLAGLDTVPDAFARRLETLGRGPLPAALMTAETLLTDTLGLAQRHSRADLGAFREALADRRQPVDPPEPYSPASQ